MIMMAMRKEERTPKKARQLVAEAETNFFFAQGKNRSKRRNCVRGK